MKIFQTGAELQWKSGEIDARSRQNRRTISAWALWTKSTHNLGEINTRSRFGQTDETGSKTNRHHTLTIDLKWSHQIQIEFVVPFRWLSPNFNVNCKDSKFQLSYPNGMHHTCLPNTSLKRINTILAVQRTCLQLNNWMEHHSNWSQEKPNTSQHWLQLTGAPVQICSQDDPTKSKWSTPNTNIGSTKWMHNPFMQAQLSYIGRSNVHRDHNTSPLCEVQLFTSTWNSNQPLLPILENSNTPNSFIRVVTLSSSHMYLLLVVGMI